MCFFHFWQGRISSNKILFVTKKVWIGIYPDPQPLLWWIFFCRNTHIALTRILFLKTQFFKINILTSAMQLIYYLNIRGFYRKYIRGFSIRTGTLLMVIIILYRYNITFKIFSIIQIRDFFSLLLTLFLNLKIPIFILMMSAHPVGASCGQY